jgi:thiamine pyrophosphokinase
MIAHIFANGSHPRDIDSVIHEEKRGDLIIAADGGADHCRLLNITPHILIGDLDSIAPALVEQYIDAGVEIIRHPARKDATDLELAIDLAMAKGAEEIVLFGVLGGRWDMSLSNVMLAASEKYKHMTISLLNVQCRMHIVHGGTTLHLEGYTGQITSLIAISTDVQGITLKGFEYPLKNATLPFGSSRGVSNLLRKENGLITLKSGTLLCVQELPGSSKK